MRDREFGKGGFHTAGLLPRPLHRLLGRRAAHPGPLGTYSRTGGSSLASRGPTLTARASHPADRMEEAGGKGWRLEVCWHRGGWGGWGRKFQARTPPPPGL